MDHRHRGGAGSRRRGRGNAPCLASDAKFYCWTTHESKVQAISRRLHHVKRAIRLVPRRSPRWSMVRSLGWSQGGWENKYARRMLLLTTVRLFDWRLLPRSVCSFVTRAHPAPKLLVPALAIEEHLLRVLRCKCSTLSRPVRPRKHSLHTAAVPASLVCPCSRPFASSVSFTSTRHYPEAPWITLWGPQPGVVI